MTTLQNQSPPSAISYVPELGALAAIDPKALDVLILPAPPRMPYLLHEGKTAVVEISGPLCYSHPFFDTYSAIRARFQLALGSSAETILLNVNSPGGDVAGAFDTSRWMRAAAQAAGKRLISFTEAQACSSGYALASAASEIYVSDTGTLGSIGVLSCLENKAAQNAALGVRHYVVASGSRKADGNPNLPVSEEALEAIQNSVDAMAAVFFGLVKEHRGGALNDPAALEAGTRIGAAAVAAGLADAVMSFDALCENVAAPPAAGGGGAIQAMSPTSGTKDPMPKATDDKDKPKEDALRASLAAAAEKDPRAQRALAAYDSDEKDAKAADEDEKKAKAADEDKPKEDAKAEFPPKKDDDKEEAKGSAAAVIGAQMAAMAAELATLRARDEARSKAEEATARAALYAANPHLAKETIAELNKLPLASAAALISTMPAPSGVPQLARNPLTGSHEPSQTDPAQATALDVAFGLAQITPQTVNVGPIQSFGVPMPKVKS